MMEIQNRKVNFDYEIIDTYETGIVLTGTEIKSIRQGKVNLKDSYAIIKNGEIFLLNMHISAYEQGNRFNHEETRTRKLFGYKPKYHEHQIYPFSCSMRTYRYLSICSSPEGSRV